MIEYKLEKGELVTNGYALEKGFIINTIKRVKNTMQHNRCMVLTPGEKVIIYDEQSIFLRLDSGLELRIWDIKKDKGWTSERNHKQFSLDGFGRTTTFGNGYKRESIHNEEYELTCFTKEGKLTDAISLLQIAAGLAKGGIIIKQVKDSALKVLGIGDIDGGIVSLDGMTILVWRGNKVYIIDNPFLADL